MVVLGAALPTTLAQSSAAGCSQLSAADSAQQAHGQTSKTTWRYSFVHGVDHCCRIQHQQHRHSATFPSY
eukprot:305026-Rhodomonas_salina.2